MVIAHPSPRPCLESALCLIERVIFAPMQARNVVKGVFSVDVEDWFHILDIASAPPLAAWENLPSRVEGNFRRLLDLFGAAGTRVTCFFLGWVARHHPQLVREAANQGHEIASHGYAHRLVYQMTRQEFLDDALRSRKLLEDISATPVRGYRSAGFSTTPRTLWFFDALAEAGYLYDSSVFPAPRGHGGIRNGHREPHWVLNRNQRSVLEFPISVANFAGKPMCFFGGGYLRLFPYWLIERMANQVIEEGRPVVFYVHPREIDPAHPRLRMPLSRRFKTYVNLSSTETKIARLLRKFPLTTFRDLISQERNWCEVSYAA
jgi:polysaccharide deacetylase family protein (PEP-CTERM system associated)